MRHRSSRRSAVVLVVFALTACVGRSAPRAAIGADAFASFAVPLQGSDAELEAVASWLSEARIVGLGEKPHGVDEYHRFGHRWFRYLVRERGFGVYALEFDQAHAARLDAYVQGERDDLDALLAERFWASILYDQALRDLLLDLRRVNEGNSERVHVAGYDAKQPALAARAVEEALRVLDSRAADEVRGLYAEALSLDGLGIFPNVYGFTGTLAIPLSAPKAGILNTALSLRGDGVRFGRLGFSVVGKSGNVEVARKTRWLGASDLSIDDRRFEITLPLAAEVDRLELEVFHRGNGTVWFDDPSAAVDGEALGPLVWSSLRVEPLAMPRLQTMDYRSDLDAEEAGNQEPALRVRCDPSIDRALRAVRSAKELVKTVLARRGDRGDEAEWLRQEARLVEQAVEWRTLIEPNRDVFLAENLRWLSEVAFPRSRVLALGHVSHTERTPRKMGGFLAETVGAKYATVSMLTLSGEHHEFGDPRTSGPSASFERFQLTAPEVGSFGHSLSKLARGDFAFDVKQARQTRRAQAHLKALGFAFDETTADAVLLFRRVTPMALLSGRPTENTPRGEGAEVP